MISSIRFVYPWAVLGAFFVIGLWVILYKIFHRSTTVRYSLVSVMAKEGIGAQSHYQRMIPAIIRIVIYFLLAIAIGRPQRVDVESKIHVEGIDIMLVLDASGSMQCFDDLKDRRTRFEVAKAEAIRFAQKRHDDQIGLVLFGKEAVSRCPLTLDKRIVQEIIENTPLGIVDPDGTVLSIGLSMAIKRLQNSKAKSKIIVLLTDGEPSPEFDINPQVAIDLAKKLGIKVYTIGIGGQEGGLINDPFFGIRPVGLKVNKELLEKIASQTGGKFFMAERPDDMRMVYNIIDSLEKTHNEAPLFTQYAELGHYPLLIALMLLFCMLVLQTFVWVSI